jgi:hypothetical protein
MTDVPLRLRILQAVSELLASISPANGYVSDLSAAGQVVRGRLLLGAREVLPMVSLIEPPLGIEPEHGAIDNQFWHGDWDILVQGWVADDKENPTDPAYVLAADVRKALVLEKLKPPPAASRTSNILGLNGAVVDFRLGALVVRPPDEISAKACFYLLVTLNIAEDMTAPFG